MPKRPHPAILAETRETGPMRRRALSVLLATAFVLSPGLTGAQTEVPSTPPRDRMTFGLIDTAGLCDNCSVVQAQGRIVPGTGRDFLAFLASNRLKPVVIVALHSSGGSMNDAMRVGSGLRTLNARVIVGRVLRKGSAVEIAPGSCLSACSFAFAGGSRRAVPERSELGVHSWMPTSLVDSAAEADRKPEAFDRKAVQDLHAATARYMDYIDRMGLDLRIVMRALQTPYEKMARLNRQELKEWKAVTEDALTRQEAGRERPVLDLNPGRSPSQAGARGAAG